MTVAEVRGALVAALRQHVPQVQGRVHVGRTWPLPASALAGGAATMPALLVEVPRVRRTSLSRAGSAPAFRTVLTLTVLARSEQRTDEAITAELDALGQAIEAAVLQFPGVRDLPEEWLEWETLRSYEAQGEVRFGQEVHAFEAQFMERFEPLGLPAFTGARLVLDAADPHDALGAYGAIAPFPAPAAPPRASGPDGRAEAETVINLPQ